MSFAELFLSEIAAYEQTGDGTALKKIIIISGLLKEVIQACAEWGISQAEMIRFVGKYGGCGMTN